MAAPLKLTDGSAAAPSLSFNSQASTGLYWPETGLLGFTALGAEILRLKSNGAVMIGSTTDDGLNKLQVTGAAKVTGTFNVTGATTLSSTLAVTGNTTVGGTFGVTGATTFSSTVAVTGNTTVGGTLSVTGGTTLTSVQINNTNSSTSFGSGENFLRVNNTSTSGLSVLQFQANGNAGASVGLLGTSTLVFSTGAGTQTERMRIDSSGNVGIGTTSPQSKLHVASGGVLRLYRSDDARHMRIFGDNNGLNLNADSTAGEQVRISSTGETVIFTGSSPTERMRIDQIGNVGIGVTPTTKLDVYGNYAVFRNGTYAGYIGFGDLAATTSSLFCVRSDNGLVFSTNGSNERMRIDSSGNIGISSTPGSYHTNYRAIVLGSQGAAFMGSNAGSSIFASSNGRFDSGGTWRYTNSSAAGLLEITDNNHIWYRAGSGSAGNALSWTEAMRLDGSGNLDLKAGSGALRINGHVSRTESSEFTCPSTNNTLVQFAHGGTRAPDVIHTILRCKTAEHSYGPGDEFVLHNLTNVTDRDFALVSGSSNITFYWISTSNLAPPIRSLSNGSAQTVTAANWRLVFKCLWL